MIFLRGLWRQKPKQWGPASTVSSVMLDRFEKLYGVASKNVLLAFNMWGPGNQLNYATGLAHTNNATFEANRLVFDGTNSIVDSGLGAQGATNRTLLTRCQVNNYTNGPVFGYGSTNTGEKWVVRSYNGLRIELQGSGYTSSFSIENSTNIGCVLNGTKLSDHTLYADDKKESAVGTTTVNTTGSTFRIGLDVYESYSLDGEIEYLYFFDTALSDDKVFAFNDNPYALIRPPLFRTYSIPTIEASIDIDLVGAAQGIGAVTGVISKDIVFSSAATCVGVVQGTPTIDTPGIIALSGSVQGIGTANSVVSKDISTVGAASSAASVDGSVLIDKALIGAVTAQGNVSGTITITEALTGDTMATYNNPTQFTVTAVGTVVITADTADAKVMISKTLHKMPYVKTEGLAVAIPVNNSSTNRGIKSEYSKMPDLYTALNGTDGTDAQGKLSLTWRPMFNASDVSGLINILTADDGVTSTVHYDADNNLLKVTDGTNTSSVACTPVLGTLYNIVCTWDVPNFLQINVDGTDGTSVPFAGKFPTEDELSFAWLADAPQYIPNIDVELLPYVTVDGVIVTNNGHNIISL